MLDFEPDDKFLLSGSADETVMVWSLESLYDSSPEEVTLPSLGPIFDARFNKDNVSILVAPDETNSLRVSKVLYFLSKKTRTRQHSSQVFCRMYGLRIIVAFICTPQNCNM